MLSPAVETIVSDARKQRHDSVIIYMELSPAVLQSLDDLLDQN